MKVTFKRTGERRYGVFVERDEAPPMWINPAPGYDAFLPHDLLHFVAEAEWGLDEAVFGDLAAGGDAKMFVPTDQRLVARTMRRRRQRPRHLRDGKRSELVASILEQAWNARSGRAALPEGWPDQLATAEVGDTRLEQVVASLDSLARRWHALRIGEALTLEWPRAEQRRKHGTVKRSG